MSWLQVETVVNQEDAEELSDIFIGIGASAVTLVDAENHPILEPMVGETPYWKMVCCRALFDASVDLESTMKQISDLLPEKISPSYQITVIKEQDWQNTWRKYVKPIYINNKLWICPNDQPLPHHKKEDIILKLNIGMAFGTGSHPTTALCLKWLTENIKPGSVVMDYGCGSGVLALAAIKLGAKQVIAIDYDPQALQATQENATLNNISENQIIVADADYVPKTPVDILIANILLQPLIELSPYFHRHLKKNGKIAMSGILDSQEEMLREQTKMYFQFNHKDNENNWILLTGIRA